MTHPSIYEVPQEKLKLYQLGIEDKADVVFLIMEDGKTRLDPHTIQQLYQDIATSLNLDQDDTNLNMFNMSDNNYQDEDPMFSSPPRSKQKAFVQFADDYKFGGLQEANNNFRGQVPPEYADDPDLYYAMQASLGVEPDQQDPVTNNAYFNVSPPGSNDDMMEERPGTGSTADINSLKEGLLENNQLNNSLQEDLHDQ